MHEQYCVVVEGPTSSESVDVVMLQPFLGGKVFEASIGEKRTDCSKVTR